MRKECPKIIVSLRNLLLMFSLAALAIGSCSTGNEQNLSGTSTAQADLAQTKLAVGTLSAEASQAADRATEQAKTASALESEITRAAATLAAGTETAVSQQTEAAELRNTSTAIALETQHTIVGKVPQAAQGWGVFRADSFSSFSEDWWTEEIDDEWVRSSLGISGGVYRWDIYAKQGVFYRIWPFSRSISDFFLSVDACKVSGPATASAGLIFRSGEGGNAYVFMIRNNRQYAFYELVKDTWNMRVDWTQATPFVPNECNRLGILAEADTFTFFINDEQINQVVDASLDRGNVGLGVELYGGESAVWEFDNFAVLVP